MGVNFSLKVRSWTSGSWDLGSVFSVWPVLPGGGLARILSSDNVSVVFVGRLGLVTFFRVASCGVGRLPHVGVAGAGDDLLPWDPVRLLAVLVYLVLVTCILLFEDREERYHWKSLFKA